VFVDEGRVKASLNDKDVNASLFRAGLSLTDALKSLEKALQPGGDADWRTWKPSKSRK
jgi:hypothetical protein